MLAFSRNTAYGVTSNTSGKLAVLASLTMLTERFSKPHDCRFIAAVQHACHYAGVRSVTGELALEEECCRNHQNTPPQAETLQQLKM